MTYTEKNKGWRVWYWVGDPIEDSVPDHENFHGFGADVRAKAFAKRMKKNKRLGYIVEIILQKDENGDDEWIEVEKHEQIG
jgi:hypothetical protein